MTSGEAGRLAATHITYFIDPSAQRRAAAAAFWIADEAGESVGFGVFFSPTRAVTADRNLLPQHVRGSEVSIVLPEVREELKLVILHRDEVDDCAILGGSTEHAYLPAFEADPGSLCGADLVLTGYRIGIEKYAPKFRWRLGFTKAVGITLSQHARHLFYDCPTYAGDYGAALILKDGQLVGIHQESVSALRERIERAKVLREARVSGEEHSIDAILSRVLSHGGCALMSHAFLGKSPA